MKKFILALAIVGITVSVFAAQPTYGAKTATLANTNYQLASSGRYRRLTIVASLSNVGIVYVGGSSVDATSYVELEAGDSVTYVQDGGELAYHYIRAASAGDSVRYHVTN